MILYLYQKREKGDILKNKIKINLEKENPLFTILKAGKIPVIRRSNDGFKNYNQKKYFDNHKNCCNKDIDYDNITGCFCLIGGIQGNWITGAHYEEKLNIGYIEEDTKIFATYTKNKKDSFNYMTALQRYQDALYLYSRDFLKDEKNGYYYDIEDFELEEEIIIDAKLVKKVCEIEYKDFYKLLRFDNTGMLSLFQDEYLFKMVLNERYLSFVELFGFDNIDTFFDKYDDLYRFPKLKTKLIQIFKDYLFSTPNEKDINLINTSLDNIKKFEEYLYKNKLNNCNFYNDSNLHLDFKDIPFKDKENNYKIEELSINYDIEKNEFHCLEILDIDKNSHYFCMYLSDKISRNEYELRRKKRKDMELKNLFNKDYLEYLIHFYDVFIFYKEYFFNIVNIKENVFLNKIAIYKKCIETLKNKNISYEFEYDLSKIYIYLNDNIIIEYDFILKDFIIEIKEEEISYYNLEKIPTKYTYIKERVNDFSLTLF